MKTHLFDKSTAAAVDHENVGGLPSIGTGLGETLGLIHVGVTEVRVGIVDILGNGPSIGRDTKQGFPVIVSLLLEETVGDLRVVEKTIRRVEVSNNATK